MKLDSIISQIRPDKKLLYRAEKIETLSVKEMLPTAFEPILNNRWIFCLEGFDSFLMKKVDLPGYKMNDISYSDIKSGKNPYSINYEVNDVMKFTIYDGVAPSGAQQIMEWIYEKNDWRHAQLKLLDPIGTVVHSWHMDLLINNFSMSSFDYQSSLGAIEYDVEAFVRDMKLER